MFRKILVCSDGSPCARDAAGTAASIAHSFGSEILALNVFQPPYADAAGLGVWAIAVEQDLIDRCADQQLEDMKQSIEPVFEPLSVAWRVIQEQGHPVDAILRVAKREHADLIVLGSRGLRGIHELLLGSVSTGVLQHAHSSVLIVRGDNAPCGAAKFRSILLASDGSPCAQKAASVAVNMAQKCAASLTVLNVYEDLSLVGQAGDKAPPIHGRDIQLYAKQWLDYVAKPVKEFAAEAGVTCSFVQEGGHPDETIIKFANMHDVDLIIVGSRGLGGFARMFLGSVSNRVVHRANSPVLVVR